MKNKLSLRHFLLLILSSVLISCSGNDDSDANNPDNTNNEDTPIGLTIGNDFYPLQNGEIEDYGSWYGEECPSLINYNLDITLYEQGITIDANGNRSGSGKAIYFEMLSDNNQLANGNYADVLSLLNSTFNRNFSSFSALDEVPEDDELYEEFETTCLDLDGYVFSREIAEIQNGNNTTEDNAPVFSFTGGQLSFERNSSNGEITMSLTGATADQGGLPVSVYYKGFLTYLDYSDKRPVNATQRRKK